MIKTDINNGQNENKRIERHTRNQHTRTQTIGIAARFAVENGKRGRKNNTQQT